MLRNSVALVTALVLGLAVVTSGALAESCQGKGKGAGHQGAGMCYHKYSADQLTQVSGEIVEVERIAHEKGKSHGIHLQLKTGEETLEVHLGPAWFLDHQEGQFEAGDKIEVTGARVKMEGKSAIIAAKIKKDDGELVLRDAEGWPVWSAWRTKASS
jgi:hypothetical protein